MDEVIFTQPESIDAIKRVLDYIKVDNHYNINHDKVMIYLGKTSEQDYILVISPNKKKYDTFKINFIFPNFNKTMEEVEKYNENNTSYKINYFEANNDHYSGIEFDLRYYPYEGPYNFALPIGFIKYPENERYVYLFAKSDNQFVLYYYEDDNLNKTVILSEFTV